MIYSDYKQDVLYSYYNQQISSFLTHKNKGAAQKEAFEWLQEYVNSLCISEPWNWKIAKKQIAAFFFGKQPSIRLFYSDNIDKGIEFVKTHSSQNIRCSYHKFDSACHSESHQISNKTLSWLMEIKGNMSQKDIIDIFTECSSPTTTCFRRLSLQYNEEVAYEMGYGQAMYVFEVERGLHDIASFNFVNGVWSIKKSLDPLLTEHLSQLVKIHETYLAMKSQCICYYLGIPQISIEGYFDTAFPNVKPKIIDIDLPFDRAFF